MAEENTHSTHDANSDRDVSRALSDAQQLENRIKPRMRKRIAEQSYTPVNKDFDVIRLRIETLRADREEQSIALRARVARWALWFVLGQLVVTNLAIVCYIGWSCWKTKSVPSEILITWLTSTIVEIIGILWVIARSLFPFNDHHRDKEAEQR